MREENAVEVKDVIKSFRVYLDKGHTLKEKFLFKSRRAYEIRHVLNGISFEVKKGEAVGLIGHNGCGKSTTLKLLTKIMYPDSGTIEMKGRVSSLIELGAGFHPDMSGRENIYINASIFGLDKKEIDKRIEDIIAFSELEEFIDNPVRTYSSGMYMRLAFSVAINVDADILLIDEILAVGDAGFQTKCFNRLKEIKAAGTTIVIVSHSLGQIEQICDRSIWIHGGKIEAIGNPYEVDMQYLDYMGKQRQVIAEKEEQRKREKEQQEKDAEQDTEPETTEEPMEETIQEITVQKESISNLEEQVEAKNTAEAAHAQELSQELVKRWGNGKARITNISLLNEEGKDCSTFRTEEQMTIQIDYTVNETVEDAVFGIGIFRVDGLQCYGTNTRIDRLERFDLESAGSASVRMEKLNLLQGKYLLDVAIECDTGIPVDYYREVQSFEVFSVAGDVGVARIEHQWML